MLPTTPFDMPLRLYFALIQLETNPGDTHLTFLQFLFELMPVIQLQLEGEEFSLALFCFWQLIPYRGLQKVSLQ